jgi:hypothetical protein
MSCCGPHDWPTRVSAIFHCSSPGRMAFLQRDNVLHNLNLIEKYVREFLGKNLRGEKAPLLDSNNTVAPEAIVQHYGR